MLIYFESFLLRFCKRCVCMGWGKCCLSQMNKSGKYCHETSVPKMHCKTIQTQALQCPRSIVVPTKYYKNAKHKNYLQYPPPKKKKKEFRKHAYKCENQVLI